MPKLSPLDQIRQLKERDELSEERRTYKRFTEIDLLLDTLNKHNITETRALLKYIPIATVACIEGVFRSILKELVDKGKPYAERTRDLESKLQLKLNFSILLEIQNKSITIGDLIGHIVPCNSLDDINAALSAILGVDFLDALKKHNRNSIFENRIAEFHHFNQHFSEIYSDLSKLFEIRHILCHEIAYSLQLDQSEVLRYYENAKRLLRQMEDYIRYCVDPDEPENVEAIVARKREQMKKMNDEVFELLARTKPIFTPDEHFRDEYNKTYDSAVEAWKVYREARARHQSSKTPSATWGSYAYCNSIIKSSRDMIDCITNTNQLC